MKTLRFIFLIIFLTILPIIIPIPSIIIDILLLFEILLIAYVYFIKNKIFDTIKKYTFFICQYSLCINIWTLRVLLFHSFPFKVINIFMLLKEKDNHSFQSVFYKYYIGIFIAIILLLFIAIRITVNKCKQELKSVIYENKIINKNNGEHFLINDSSIREIIIKGYKNIIKYNYIILIYLFVNIAFVFLALYLLNRFFYYPYEKPKFSLYYLKEASIVMGSLIGIFIGIFYIIVNKLLLNQQNKYIDDNIYKIQANS